MNVTLLGGRSWDSLGHPEAVLVYLNWTAPSTLKTSTRSAQCSAASFLLGSSPRAVGLLLQPEFTYKRGELWMLENSVVKQLAQAGITLDRSFCLQFKEKAWKIQKIPKYVVE